MQNTLTAYNTLVTQPSKNMKSDYKQLLKAMDSMNKKVTDATTKIAAMQTASDTLFQGRGETIKNIQDQSLQQQAQQRLQQNQTDFGRVLDALRDGGQALEPFRKQLADQIHFLGSDLNASAAASLKPQAEKLNTDGAAVFTKADKAIAQANEYPIQRTEGALLRWISIASSRCSIWPSTTTSATLGSRTTRPDHRCQRAPDAGPARWSGASTTRERVQHSTAVQRKAIGTQPRAAGNCDDQGSHSRHTEGGSPPVVSKMAAARILAIGSRPDCCCSR